MPMFRRVLTGRVAPGKHGEFLRAVEEALDYQAARGIEAQFSVWDAVTGPTSNVEIIAEFEDLRELEQYEELAAQDQHFASLRRAVREAMIFDSATINIHRKLV
jgi:hypothetical protein